MKVFSLTQNLFGLLIVSSARFDSGKVVRIYTSFTLSAVYDFSGSRFNFLAWC